MTYDRRAIMKAAWERVRGADRARFSLRFILRNALRAAWADARANAAAARRAAERVAPMTEAEIRLACIDNKDRLTVADYAAMDALRATIHAQRFAA